MFINIFGTDFTICSTSFFTPSSALPKSPLNTAPTISKIYLKVLKNSDNSPNSPPMMSEIPSKASFTQSNTEPSMLPIKSKIGVSIVVISVINESIISKTGFKILAIKLTIPSIGNLPIKLAIGVKILVNKFFKVGTNVLLSKSTIGLNSSIALLIGSASIPSASRTSWIIGIVDSVMASLIWITISNIGAIALSILPTPGKLNLKVLPNKAPNSCKLCINSTIPSVSTSSSTLPVSNMLSSPFKVSNVSNENRFAFFIESA